METVKHFKQEQSKSCGAAAYRQILSILGISISESQARADVKCKSGTHDFNVISALKNRFPDKEIEIVHPNEDYKWIFNWLNYISRNNILYVSGEFISNCGRGRNRNRHHAICLYNGFVYDPGEPEPFPIEAYFHVFNRNLFVKAIILVDNSGVN